MWCSQKIPWFKYNKKLYNSSQVVSIDNKQKTVTLPTEVLDFSNDLDNFKKIVEIILNMGYEEFESFLKD